jgi:TetR/AcrR family transcriptional regulator, cholesterol catabolism regulator
MEYQLQPACKPPEDVRLMEARIFHALGLLPLPCGEKEPPEFAASSCINSSEKPSNGGSKEMTVVPIAARGPKVAGSVRKLRTPRSPRRRAPQIIAAAARVFAERGFHGASTQDIADVLGIRQASLYYYFASKEAALERVCLKGVEGFFEAAKAIAAGPGSAGERLAGLIRSHLTPLVDRGDFVKVFLNERQHLPTESRRRIGKWSRGIERIFEDVIKQGVRGGEFRHDVDTRLATLAILGMANAAASWYRKEEVAADHIAGEFARLVLDGVSAPAPTMPAGASHKRPARKAARKRRPAKPPRRR